MKTVVIIGAGNMAKEHLDVLTQMPQFEVVGIYSRTEVRAQELARRYKIPFVAKSLDHLFVNTKADGAVIAVSETATKEICEQAVSYDWELLVEKPIGLNLSDTRKIYDAASNKSKKIYAALNRRYYGGIMDAQRILDEKSTGMRVVSINDQEAPELALKVGRNRAVTNQWHFANSIHLIDLFRIFARGVPVSIENVCPWRGPGTMMTHSIIKFDSGDIGIYHSLWDAPGPWSVNIETRELRVALQPVEHMSVQTYPSRAREDWPIHHVDVQHKPGFLRQMEEFLKALNGESNRLVDILSYLDTAQLVDALYTDVRRVPLKMEGHVD